jgi:lipopolysaccharide/colanic/teichoic acid biosynthesis glycosyltransferase
MTSVARSCGVFAKRLLDVVAAICLLLVLAPLFLLVALAIKFNSPGPIFFRQERIGREGRGFRIFKFRTMTADADRLTRGLPGDSANPLITSVGRHLRNYRIDELPQLINVVRGEMSLVGPRPLVPLYSHAWTSEERKRLNMLPGMTGWQQINGAGTLTWEERAAMDVWYVEHWSFRLDCLILLRTPWVVVRGNTVYGKDGQDRSAIPNRLSQAVETTDAAGSTKRN